MDFCRIDKICDIDNVLPESTKSLSLFITSIIEMNKETFTKVFESVNESNFNTAYKILELAFIIRPLKTKIFINLFKMLSNKFVYKNKNNTELSKEIPMK